MGRWFPRAPRHPRAHPVLSSMAGLLNTKMLPSRLRPRPVQKLFSTRFTTMFVVGAAEAVASGLLPIATNVTKGLVKFAAAHMRDLKQADVNTLSNSFGNFDRAVGLGWLIYDAVSPVGAPLCDRRATAFAVGSKARRQADNIKTEIRNAKLKAQRAACKLEQADPQRKELERQAAEAESIVLRDTIDVGIASVEAPARSTATGSRKRARETEAQVSPLDRRVADAEAACERADKELDPALRAQEIAERLVATKKRVLDRISKQLIAKLKASGLPKLMRLMQSADRAHQAAQLAAKDAEIAYLLAMLDASQAQNELLSSESDRTDALIDELFD